MFFGYPVPTTHWVDLGGFKCQILQTLDLHHWFQLVLQYHPSTLHISSFSDPDPIPVLEPIKIGNFETNLKISYQIE